MLEDDYILAMPASTVIRAEGEKALLFNSISDEMHLIPREALPILDLCRGMLSVSQIEELVLAPDQECQVPGEGRAMVRRFLQALVDRKLLQVRIPVAVVGSSTPTTDHSKGSKV